MCSKREKHERRKRWIVSELKRLQEWKARIQAKREGIPAGDKILKTECILEQSAWNDEYRRAKQILRAIEDIDGEEWKLK